MNKVKHILKAKGNKVWTLEKDATVLDALQLMAKTHTGSVVVVNDEDKLVGIFTERDFARKVGLQEINPVKIKVVDVMNTKPITVDPEDSVGKCMEIMTEQRIRHLPVLKNGKLVGIVSIGDVVKDIIEELEFMVQQLENYLTGLR